VTDDERMVLAGRAAKLARPQRHADEVEAVELLMLELGRESLAIEPRFVMRTSALPELTTVPGLDDVFLGVVNHGGEILPVIDLLALLGGGRTVDRPELLVVLGERRAELGLAVDEAEMQTVPRWAESTSGSLIAATILGNRSVLSGDALLRDPRLWPSGSISADATREARIDDAFDDR
jgi:chemotaxis signal transduction protein